MHALGLQSKVEMPSPSRCTCLDYLECEEDGAAYVGWSQEQAQSCGPACLYMLQSIIRKSCLVGGEARIRQLLRPKGCTVQAGTSTFSVAACLDPWYGFQQPLMAALPRYVAICSPTARCQVGSGGRFSGWTITLD